MSLFHTNNTRKRDANIDFTVPYGWDGKGILYNTSKGKDRDLEDFTGKVIGMVAEFPALVEAIPRFVTSAKGFPAAIKASAAATLGLQAAEVAGTATTATSTAATVGQSTANTVLAPTSVAAAGGVVTLTTAMLPLAAVTAVVVGATVLLVSALRGMKAGNEEMAKGLERRYASERALVEATDMTTEETQNRIDEIEREQSINDELLETAKERNDLMQAGVREAKALLGGGFIGAGLFAAQDALLGVGDSARVTAEELDKEQTISDELADEHAELTAQLDSEAVAANDASQALLKSIDTIGETRRFEQEALAGSVEDNKKRAQTIVDEKAIVQEQIAEIERSGITSIEAKEKLADLNSELVSLEQQSDILASSAVKAAEAEQLLSDSTDDLAKELASSAKDITKARKAEAKASSAVHAATAKASAAASKLSAKQAADIKKLVADQDEAVLKSKADAFEEQLDAQDEFDTSMEDKLKNQSFLEAIDEQDSFADKSIERGEDQQEELTSLRQGNAEIRAERLNAQALQLADAAASSGATIAAADKRLEEATSLRVAAEEEEAKLAEELRKSELELRKSELQLVKTHQENILNLSRDRIEAESQVYQGAGQGILSVAEAFKAAIDSMFAALEGDDGGAIGGLRGAFTEMLEVVLD